MLGSYLGSGQIRDTDNAHTHATFIQADCAGSKIIRIPPICCWAKVGEQPYVEKIVRGLASGTVAGSSNSGEGSRGQGARAKIRGVG